MSCNGSMINMAPASWCLEDFPLPSSDPVPRKLSRSRSFVAGETVLMESWSVAEIAEKVVDGAMNEVKSGGCDDAWILVQKPMKMKEQQIGYSGVSRKDEANYFGGTTIYKGRGAVESVDREKNQLMAVRKDLKKVNRMSHKKKNMMFREDSRPVSNQIVRRLFRGKVDEKCGKIQNEEHTKNTGEPRSSRTFEIVKTSDAKERMSSSEVQTSRKLQRCHRVAITEFSAIDCEASFGQYQCASAVSISAPQYVIDSDRSFAEVLSGFKCQSHVDVRKFTIEQTTGEKETGNWKKKNTPENLGRKDRRFKTVQKKNSTARSDLLSMSISLRNRFSSFERVAAGFDSDEPDYSTDSSEDYAILKEISLQRSPVFTKKQSSGNRAQHPKGIDDISNGLSSMSDKSEIEGRIPMSGSLRSKLLAPRKVFVESCSSSEISEKKEESTVAKGRKKNQVISDGAVTTRSMGEATVEKSDIVWRWLDSKDHNNNAVAVMEERRKKVPSSSVGGGGHRSMGVRKGMMTDECRDGSESRVELKDNEEGVGEIKYGSEIEEEARFPPDGISMMQLLGEEAHEKTLEVLELIKMNGGSGQEAVDYSKSRELDEVATRRYSVSDSLSSGSYSHGLGADQMTWEYEESTLSLMVQYSNTEENILDPSLAELRSMAEDPWESDYEDAFVDNGSDSSDDDVLSLMSIVNDVIDEQMNQKEDEKLTDAQCAPFDCREPLHLGIPKPYWTTLYMSEPDSDEDDAGYVPLDISYEDYTPVLIVDEELATIRTSIQLHFEANCGWDYSDVNAKITDLAQTYGYITSMKILIDSLNTKIFYFVSKNEETTIHWKDNLEVILMKTPETIGVSRLLPYLQKELKQYQKYIPLYDLYVDESVILVVVKDCANGHTDALFFTVEQETAGLGHFIKNQKHVEVSSFVHKIEKFLYERNGDDALLPAACDDVDEILQSTGKLIRLRSFAENLIEKCVDKLPQDSSVREIEWIRRIIGNKTIEKGEKRNDPVLITSHNENDKPEVCIKLTDGVNVEFFKRSRVYRKQWRFTRCGCKENDTKCPANDPDCRPNDEEEVLIPVETNVPDSELEKATQNKDVVDVEEKKIASNESDVSYDDSY